MFPTILMPIKERICCANRAINELLEEPLNACIGVCSNQGNFSGWCKVATLGTCSPNTMDARDDHQRDYRR
jgi:hypothetical protein